MKKGQIYEGLVTEYRFPNKGVVLCDGREVVVKGALPGQKIRFTASKIRAGVCEGRLLDVLERSPLEDSQPACSHFGECGGCTYQNLSYESQLKLKSEAVKDLISSVYPEFVFEGIKGSPVRHGYRNKMEFTFGDECKDGPFALGLHRKGSFHDIVNVRDCSIVHEDFNIIRNAVRDFFNEYYVRGEIDFYKKTTHRGYLRHLLIRKAVNTGEILIALVTASPSGSDRLSDEQTIIDAFQDMVLNLNLEGHIEGLIHIYNDALSDVVKADSSEILFGRDYIYETICGLKFKISTFSFFQTNSLGAEVLYRKALEYASFDKGGVIYDLYSGTGTIAQLMSPAAERVIGVEIVEEAVEAAKENAALNNIDNVEFIAGDVLKVICGDEGENLPAPDLIILDPPREGVHPKALGRILSYGVDKIVYISCKPTSLAEDLRAFKIAGYIIEKASCVDMFPDTVHVETVVLMTKE